MKNNEPTVVSIYNTAAEIRLYNKYHELLVFAPLFSETGEIISNANLSEELFEKFSGGDEMTSDELLISYLSALEDALAEVRTASAAVSAEILETESPHSKDVGENIPDALLSSIAEEVNKLREVSKDHELLRFVPLSTIEGVVASEQSLLDQFSKKFSTDDEDGGSLEEVFTSYLEALENGFFEAVDKLEDTLVKEQTEEANA
jgi:hypothetical protein